MALDDLASKVLHAVDKGHISQKMARMLAETSHSGDAIWSMEEQEDIIDTAGYRDLGPMQFRTFLSKLNRERCEEWADKNQMRITDFFPGEIEEYRSDIPTGLSNDWMRTK